MTGHATPRELKLVVGFVAAACAYMFFLEPWGHDTWFHLQRLQDIERQFAWGHLRAYFAENAAQGKGLPVWVYYSQWIYWPLMLLTALGTSPLVALKVLYCALLVVCGVGCHRLLRLHADADDAAIGTLLFMTSNYVVGEVFQRSAYSELLSVAFLPLLLAAMNRTVLQRGRGSATALVLLSAMMILAHPLSFMNAGCALVAYSAYIANAGRIPYRHFLRLVPLFALALALTAFYWLPAVIETRYVLGAAGVPTPLSETFLTIKRYLNFSGITTLGFVLTVLTPLVAGSLLIRRQAPDGPVAWQSWPLVAGIAAYVLLTLRVSEPLYDSVSLLASNLWVWRVLYPMTLLSVIFVTVNLRALPASLRRRSALGGLASLAILQAVALVLWNTAADVSIRRVPLGEIAAKLAVESEQEGGFGIDEYLPDPKHMPRSPGECGVVRSVEPNDRYAMSWSIASAEADACIHVSRYWNTRYAAWIGGEAIPVYANVDGEIVLAPAGRAGLLTLRFTRPAYVRLATVLSGIAALLLLGRLCVRSRST